MKRQLRKQYSMIQIHLAVLLFGLAGLFAKFLDLSAMEIVLGRVFFASVALFFIIKFKGLSLRLSSGKDNLILIATGMLLTLHWWSFFYAIQLSTVAVGLLTYSTFPVFVTFIEPLFFKDKLKLTNIMIAGVTFIGVALVIPELNWSNQVTAGAGWGMVSGFTFAVLTIANRHYVRKYSGLVISFYQTTVSAVILLPMLFYVAFSWTVYNLTLLILLGVIFTAVAHTLFIIGMKQVKAHTASIIACLEPVYGIIFAMVLLEEIPESRVILGGSIIFISILFVSFRDK